MAALDTGGEQAPVKHRPWHVRTRLLLVVAALFAGATVLGGAAGFAVGKIASMSAGHEDQSPPFYRESPDWRDGFAGGNVDNR